MKLLTAVFSYERYYLLKNTIESFFEFGPQADLLIVDDGSADPRVLEYLKGLESRATVLRNSRDTPRIHGALYINMNRAVDFALTHKYSHIYFVQDDVQFMWQDIDFHKRIESVFATCPDAAMVSAIFMKGIQSRQMQQRLLPHPSGLCWHLAPYSIADIGVIPLTLFTKRTWRFTNSEIDNSRSWRQWGYKLYILPTSNLAFVPWPQVHSSNRSFGSERAPREKYFLKPMTQFQVDQLKKAAKNLKKIPFHEDYCLPWGWNCLSPYWFTKLSREYWMCLWKSIRHNVRWPKLVRAS